MHPGGYLSCTQVGISHAPRVVYVLPAMLLGWVFLLFCSSRVGISHCFDTFLFTFWPGLGLKQGTSRNPLTRSGA